MPFTVTGAFDDGATYTVQITGRSDRPVIGSHRAAALVELHQGEPVPLSPTGPVRAVSGDDEATVLAVLREHSNVIEEGPGAPRQARVPGS
ncbi:MULTISPECIES: hypothetical protein [unclassified Streptomyces]|uniref:hypothetical protein n=1 Tax=unclassified Streptomyces TaxID=2593676 RepID=UPI002256734B|nr:MULTISPECIES: hypothetical protein [unclassified Streptomyces]MCX4976450.1 hypothetical protein [Streptomyces sp. NBC_00620]WRZ24320.1 hypothetical protein OHT59_40315 [Streptomyces sp. NBC_00243]